MMNQGKKREPNILHIWGNKDSMNLNPMILTNIQSSNYFKNSLYELKTYHEVIDEIFYRVRHLEPWEKGSRKTQGLTGMCGGVRGVGGGGIVSTAFCILYKLYTLKLTRKQVLGLMVHQDSPYIRGLGFMYVRYTQQPNELFDWYEAYLDDTEEIDVKAGGGFIMTIGNMLKQWLTRLEWFDTLFPRIPVPMQQEIEYRMLQKYGRDYNNEAANEPPIAAAAAAAAAQGRNSGERESARRRSRSPNESRSRSRSSRSSSRSRRNREDDSTERNKSKHKSSSHHKKHKHHKHRKSSKSKDEDKHRHRSSHKHHRRERDSKERKSRSRSRSRSETKKSRRSSP